MSNIELTYYITGCPLEDIQVIPVTKDFRISFLLTAIQDAHLKATGHTIVQLRAYQFDKAEDELTAFDKSNYVKLKNHFRVGGYWPNVPDEGLINLVVEAETLAKARVKTSKHQEPHEEDDDVLSDLRVVARLEEAQKKTVKSHMEGKSSSEAAKHVNFKKKQEESDHGIYNGRPYDKTGLPIQLFHEVFNKFTSRIQENEPLPTSKLLHAQKFMMDSQNIYTTENDRCANLEQNLRDSCGLNFSREVLEGDGVRKVVFQDIEAYCAILAVKNEIGTGGSDPSVQGAQSYARCWSHPRMAAMRRTCCCPSFILASAGPWICILGAVYLDRVIVQPLTEFLWLALDNWESTRLVYMARVLDSFAACIRELDTYYLSLNPMSSDPQISRFFPHFLTYRDAEDSLISFTYSGFVVPESKNRKHRALFKASVKTGETLVVKFPRKYNAIAHRLLAQEGLAPELLYDSLDDSSHKGPQMIAMQWLDGVDLLNYERSQETPPDSIRRDIWRALEVLRNHNLVFGDLRGPNVMLVKGLHKISGMLVDFDWCGIADEATYPISMNTEITWAQGATPGGLMRKQHDLDMYASLFPGFA